MCPAFPDSHYDIINPLFTECIKLVWSKWISALFFFWVSMDLESILVHKLAEKELGQHPGILTFHLVNNPLSLSTRCTGKSQAKILMYN